MKRKKDHIREALNQKMAGGAGETGVSEGTKKGAELMARRKGGLGQCV